MRRFHLSGGLNDVSNIVLGQMRIETLSLTEIRDMFDLAMSSGINVFDHADIYGNVAHACELRFSDALNLSSDERTKIILQTKVGVIKDSHHFDLSYDHILSSVKNSLSALQTDYIDILLLHRPDALGVPDEIARAVQYLFDEGHVLNIGVSNYTSRQMELLQKSLDLPLRVNQLQLSVAHAPMIASGLASNMQEVPQSVRTDDDVLDYCRINGITVQAWSPFQYGFFEGSFIRSPKYPELNRVMSRLAVKYDVGLEAIAVAWLTRLPASLQVVLGTTRVDRLSSAVAGSDLRISRPEWYELFRSAGYSYP